MEARLIAFEAKFDRAMELIQQEFHNLRAEMNERFAEVNERLRVLRVDIDERFQSVSDRLGLLEQMVAKNKETTNEMRAELDKVRTQLYGLEDRIDMLQKSTNGLGDDMRQRFRLVNDQLSAVEKRLAA